MTTRSKKEAVPVEEEIEEEEPVATGFTPHVTERSRRSDDTGPRRVTIQEMDPPEGEGTSLEGLRRQLSMAFTQIDALTREAQRPREAPRRFSERTSIAGSLSGAEGKSRAKLEKPNTFNGEYSEIHNVLNWIHDVTKYFQGTSCPPEDQAVYARSYFGPTVKAWMDATFPSYEENPTFEELCEHLKLRFLPPDHAMRVELKFEEMAQHSDSLQRYVERFQIMNTAMVTAEVETSEKRKILRFIAGLEKEEERRFLLDKNPTELSQLYIAVVTLRQSKQLARRSTYTPQPKNKNRDDKRLHALSKEEQKRAREKGLCLGCGKAGHFIAVCPETRRALKALSWQQKSKSSKKSTAATAGSSKKSKKFAQLLTELYEEMEEEEKEEEAGKSDTSSSSGSEAEESSSDQGNSEAET